MTDSPAAPDPFFILGESAHSLSLFSEEEIASLPLFWRGKKPYVTCAVSDKDRPAKPEEIVRQLWALRLMRDYGYPKERIAVEKPVYFGSAVHEKAADIVVMDVDDPTAAYIIVEVKKPKRKDGEEQLKSYCNAEGSPVGIWSNGHDELILHRTDPNIFVALTDLPHSDQSVSDVLNEQWTFKDLEVQNKLRTGQTTLKSIILSMEDLVLANAGVDAFEEVFKLIYAKLFDEWQCANKQTSYLRFRVAGATPSELYSRIDDLFQAAKDKWPGVFLDGEKIDLLPAHLVTCVSLLQDVKLFNSNLQVIDEAFEYLSLEVGKAKKGQYFTPRYVIDMAVKMLNPADTEFVIDTAAGSCGFTVHSIFHIWGSQFTAEGPNEWQREYAREKVYAVDFDARSVKIAKALNLIAGDGKTNVFRANTLDPKSWDVDVRSAFKPRLTKLGTASDRRENEKSYRYFSFDIVLTNPPFAGDIVDSRILHQYDIAKKDDRHWQKKVGRDVLFIERNFQFLRPGGRMAIVLPQGRLNNSSEEGLRRWIGKRGRILAVVGLHPDTFRPHTATKTSVVFLQKWNETPSDGPLCPFMDDYPIFFGTSNHPGKDTTGEYVYLLSDRGLPLTDHFGHPLIDHDLFDWRQVLDRQLARKLESEADPKAASLLLQAHEAKVSLLPHRVTIAEEFSKWALSEGFSFAAQSVA